MKIFDRLQSWIRAMEDIEDPVGVELRRLRERVRALETPQTTPSADEKRDAQ
jgi:hypothetical protein